MRIQILIPDSLQKPMGGMGEQAKQILSAFPDGYTFDVIGSHEDEKYSGNHYHYHPICDLKTYCGMPEPLAQTFLNQTLYVNESHKINRPDLIHAFDWSTFWAGRILSKEYGVPFIVTIQLGIGKATENQIHPIQIANHHIAESLEMSGLIEADRIIQVSQAYAKLYPGFLSPKTTIIPNGINMAEWVQSKRISLPGNRPIKIIYIGRFATMKNLHSILEANIPDDVDLIFIGSHRGSDPEIQNTVYRKCNEKEYMHYVGPKYGQEKINWLMSADAMIVPSIHEPFGIVGLEALAAGTILLSSFVGGMGDYLTDDCAINCGTTPKSISNAIKKMIELTADERSKFINNGLAVCKEYDWAIQANKLAEVYQKVKNG